MKDYKLCAYKKPNVTIQINQPDGWHNDKATVTFTVADVAHTGNFEIAKIQAKVGQNGSWTDVTEDRKLEQRNGKYCVEFNYFRNNDNARRVLSWWKEKCLEWCYDIPEPDRMGDQKYLNQFTTLFSGVHELQHLGGGTAPWNLEQYGIVSRDGTNIVMSDAAGKKFPLVFYHFQNIRYLPGHRVNLKSQTHDKKRLLMKPCGAKKPVRKKPSSSGLPEQVISIWWHMKSSTTEK